MPILHFKDKEAYQEKYGLSPHPRHAPTRPQKYLLVARNTASSTRKTPSESRLMQLRRRKNPEKREDQANEAFNRQR